MENEKIQMSKTRYRRFLSRTLTRSVKRVIICGFILFLVAAFINYLRQIRSTKVNENKFQKSCSENELAYIASNLGIEVVVNDGSFFSINVANNGKDDIFYCYWEIYFSMIAIPLKPRFMAKKFGVVNVNGFLFKIFPFSPTAMLLKSQDVASITAECLLQSKYFVFPNWIIVSRDLPSRVVSSTSISHYPNMVKMNPTYSSLERFSENEKLNTPSEKINTKLVIPTPLYINASNYEILISKSWSINFNAAELTLEAGLLEEFLGTNKVTNSTKNVIYLNLVENLDDISNESNIYDLKSPEAYRLITFKDKIVLEATSSSGIFYGIQTIFSLCNSKSTSGEKWMTIANVTDVPRYRYRGLMIDVARHFLGLDFIKKVITVMSRYKMNHLHLHLTDDEGWRIEIPSLPELTSIGARPTFKLNSKRKFDFLNAYLGTVPVNDISKRQYFTQQEYRSILKHASLYHVTVIPEIDFPGHSHAALVSMRGKKNLKKDVKVSQYTLEDLQDNSDDSSINNVADTVLNVCQESTLDFMGAVVETMIQYHKDDQPLKMIHLGGDEVSEMALVQSPVCKNLLKKEMKKLRSYVLKKLLEIGQKHKVKVILWESNHRETDFGNLPKPTIHFWLPSKDREYIFENYVSHDLDVILSEAKAFYLDHPYEACSHENGLRWATSSINEYDIFKYIPPDPCVDTEKNCAGDAKHVLGIQANLWGELVLEEETAEKMLFPRLLAVAERAWHEPDWQTKHSTTWKELHRDWLAFADALVQRELATLDHYSIKYRIPPPGLRASGRNTIDHNTLLPGLPVVMSTDQGKTWADSDGVLREGAIYATASGKRRSRSISLDS